MVNIRHLLLSREALYEFFFENPKHEIYGIYGQSLAYAPHLHNHLELVGMIEGKAMAYVEEKVYEINSGDAFFIFPNQIHHYEKIADENYILLLFPMDILPEYTSVFQSKVPKSALIPGALKQTCAAVHAGNPCLKGQHGIRQLP